MVIWKLLEGIAGREPKSLRFQPFDAILLRDPLSARTNDTECQGSRLPLASSDMAREGMYLCDSIR